MSEEEFERRLREGCPYYSPWNLYRCNNHKEWLTPFTWVGMFVAGKFLLTAIGLV